MLHLLLLELPRSGKKHFGTNTRLIPYFFMFYYTTGSKHFMFWLCSMLFDKKLEPDTIAMAARTSAQIVNHFGQFPSPKAFKKYILCHAFLGFIVLIAYYRINGGTGKLLYTIDCTHSPQHRHLFKVHQFITFADMDT